jgi:transmembrane sensor
MIMDGLRKKLKDFLSGKDNPQGKALYDAWYKSFDDTKAPIEDPSPEDIARELDHIKGRESKTVVQLTPRVPYWRMAAAVLLLASIGIALYVSNFNPFQHAVPYSEHVTEKGQRLALTLPDGSSVWLNADTKLRAPEAFDGGLREVFLEGEAYFNVAHDPRRPFIIHTGQVTTTVLGTAFNVRNYPGQLPEVAVVSGKVSVQTGQGAGHTAVVLERGHRAIVAPLNILTDIFDDFERYETWKDGKLVFEDRPISEVLATISRYYGIDVRVKDPNLGTCRISTTLESITKQEAIDLLCLLLKATAENKNNTYWLSGPGCN